MASRISILGSTGSIGIQTLDVVRNLGLEVLGLAAHSNIELLEKQAREFKPVLVAVSNDKAAVELRARLKDLNIEVSSGIEGIKKVAVIEAVDTVVSSIVGIAGLIPTMEAIRHKKDIALANKETLVTAGALVMSEARKNNVNILPVDSEHAAIFQCIMGNNNNDISKIILTASGGPFRGKNMEELKRVRPEEALRHPNWVMGSKITIDSATLMNKGLEVIEAKWLFNVEPDRIQVLIHPQSVIHSMVEYKDGSVIAQMGSPDMRIPIQFALTYPKRCGNAFSKLDFLKSNNLTFEKPDLEAFPALGLAYEALRTGGTMPVVLNAANEVSVGLFLKGEIGFTDIAHIVEKLMKIHTVNINPCLDDIIEVDRWARDMVEKETKRCL